MNYIHNFSMVVQISTPTVFGPAKPEEKRLSLFQVQTMLAFLKVSFAVICGQMAVGNIFLSLNFRLDICCQTWFQVSHMDNMANRERANFFKPRWVRKIVTKLIDILINFWNEWKFRHINYWKYPRHQYLSTQCSMRDTTPKWVK